MAPGRNLSAELVHEVIKRLWDDGAPVEPTLSIDDLIAAGESQELELKSSGRWNLHTVSQDPKMEHVLVKTVCGFLNAEGGVLIIGVADGGEVLGLEKDYATLSKKPDRDGYELWLRQHLDNSLSGPTAGVVRIAFEEVANHEVCLVRVGTSTRPVFAKPVSGNGDPSEFWVRVGNATKQLYGEDMIGYQEVQWG